jgi:hypothetical protein
MCCTIALVGVTLQTATKTPVEILAGRIVLGIANGRKLCLLRFNVHGIDACVVCADIILMFAALAATTPIYVQETSVVGVKRTVDTMLMVFWGIGGISAATWFDYAMLKAPDHSAWRAALGMQAVFLVIALVLVAGCPDSPR